MCQSYGSRRIEIQLSKENEYVISLGICKLFVTAKYTAKYTARTSGNNSVTSSNSEQLEQQSESKPYKALNDGFMNLQQAVLVPLLVK